MPFRLIIVSLAAFLVIAGCEEKPKVSAQQMKRALMVNIFAFNKDLTGHRFDDARSFVAPSAEANFEDVIAAMRAGEYNLLLSDEPPHIDYLKGEARVPVSIFLGEHAAGQPRPSAKSLGKQTHLWRFNSGSWQWYGVSPQ